MFRILALSIACLFSAAAQDLRRPRPVVVAGEKLIRAEAEANDIAKDPSKFQKPTRVGGRDLADLKEQGEQVAGHAAGSPDFQVILTKEANSYLTKCRSAGIVPVFQGEVRQNPETGKLRLHLTKGLNTSR